MEKPFLLVLWPRQIVLSVVDLENFYQAKLSLAIKVEWSVLTEEKLVYQMKLSPAQAGRLKEPLDNTGLFKKIELYEYVSW